MTKESKSFGQLWLNIALLGSSMVLGAGTLCSMLYLVPATKPVFKSLEVDLPLITAWLLNYHTVIAGAVILAMLVNVTVMAMAPRSPACALISAMWSVAFALTITIGTLMIHLPIIKLQEQLAGG